MVRITWLLKGAKVPKPSKSSGGSSLMAENPETYEYNELSMDPEDELSNFELIEEEHALEIEQLIREF